MIKAVKPVSKPVPSHDSHFQRKLWVRNWSCESVLLFGPGRTRNNGVFQLPPHTTSVCGCSGWVQLQLGRWDQTELHCCCWWAITSGNETGGSNTVTHLVQKLGGRRLSPWIAHVRPARGRPRCPGNTEGNTLVESTALKSIVSTDCPTDKHFPH